MNILEMAMAAKMAGGNGGGGGSGSSDGKHFGPDGVILRDSLPEGYPYKETRVTVDASALFGPGAILCKVSDNTPEPMEVGASLAVWFDGSPMVGQVTLAGDDWFAGSELAVSVAYKAGATLVAGPMSIIYPESGVYFKRVPGAVSATGVAWDSTATEPDITWDGVVETIHTMAPEFLPAGVGGGVPAVTTSDNGKFLRVVNGAWAAVALENAEGGNF